MPPWAETETAADGVGWVSPLAAAETADSAVSVSAGSASLLRWASNAAATARAAPSQLGSRSATVT